jgi:hypothetical protein
MLPSHLKKRSESEGKKLIVLRELTMSLYIVWLREEYRGWLDSGMPQQPVRAINQNMILP